MVGSLPGRLTARSGAATVLRVDVGCSVRKLISAFEVGVARAPGGGCAHNISLQRPVVDKVHVARTRHALGALICARFAHPAAAELGR